MTDKILRKNKIGFLALTYLEVIEGLCQYDIAIYNQIIIDSVGISGLKEIKQKAWKN